jgi:hypothetical protein
VISCHAIFFFSAHYIFYAHNILALLHFQPRQYLNNGHHLLPRDVIHVIIAVSWSDNTVSTAEGICHRTGHEEDDGRGTVVTRWV